MSKFTMRERLWRPRGIVTIRVFKDSEFIRQVRGRNLFVNAGAIALARLLHGVANNTTAVIGFGTGSSGPLVTDTALDAGVYYKAIDSASDDGAGNETINWSLTPTDYGTTGGFTLWELGLFANYTSVSLPGVTAPVPMFAHKVLASSVGFGSGFTLTGTWELSF